MTDDTRVGIGQISLRKVVIVGVGLIGGSFAAALKRNGCSAQIVGIGRNKVSLERAIELGLIDCASDDFKSAFKGCDLVMIAAPVGQSAAIFEAIGPYLESDTIVTDAGSTKSDVVAAARQALGGRIGQFVPGHPIAGREMNGPDAAIANLYDDKRVILCPLPENSVSAIARVRQIWEFCGAQVITLEPVLHDEILASVSHLPHLLAYILVAQIVASPYSVEKLALAGGGFRDFTRIAASSPEMWSDIAFANRDAIVKEIDHYANWLARIRAMIESGDVTGLRAVLEVASQTRMNWGPQQ